MYTFKKIDHRGSTARNIKNNYTYFNLKYLFNDKRVFNFEMGFGVAS